jgi:hypothetical protein
MRRRSSRTKARTPFRFPNSAAAAYDGGQLGAVLDRDNTASEVWADTAYRSQANLTLLSVPASQRDGTLHAIGGFAPPRLRSSGSQS